MDLNTEEVFSKYRDLAAKKTENPDDNTAAYKSRFEDITQETYSWGAIAEVYRTTESQQQQKRKAERFGDIALVLRRLIPYGENNSFEKKTSLEIQSVTLRAAFSIIAADLVNVNLHENPILIPEPYVELYHCKDRLQQAIERTSDDDSRTELRLLQAFYSDYIVESVERFHSFVDHGFVVFDLVKFLFSPGSLVVVPNELVSGKPIYWAAIVEHCEIEEDKSRQIEICKLTVSYTGARNENFGTISTQITIPYFNELQRIVELPIFPMKYHPQREALYQKFLQRGEKHKQLYLHSILSAEKKRLVAAGTHRRYDGPFWRAVDKESSSEGHGLSMRRFRGAPSSHCVGRIVIDPSGMIEEIPTLREDVRQDQTRHSSILQNSRSVNLPDESWLPSPKKTKNGLVDEAKNVAGIQLVTLSPLISGFCLSQRQWGFFLVDDVVDITWNEDAYVDLQINPVYKESVKKLVKEHRSAPKLFDDVIEGKGAGLVFLLHGPPGSGKTMTAETVAETLRCPLYYTTGGELGVEVDVIELRMQVIFQRIQRWGAILLFDEADIFMAKRTEDNMERNALVSILLRSLEYQSGILFLTTNRISDFDTAFYSRIHIQIKFENPDASRRVFIWKKLARQLQHDIQDADFEKLATLAIDGRRIKNVLKVASLLMRARGHDARLQLEDVSSALHISAGDPEHEQTEREVQSFEI